MEASQALDAQVDHRTLPTNDADALGGEGHPKFRLIGAGLARFLFPDPQDGIASRGRPDAPE